MSEPAAWYRIGHVTRTDVQTGCTVILFNELVPASVDVRGGAPGTRETDLLGAGRLVGAADAFLLSGGSAFGLAAADGVARFLSERGRGFPTSVRPVPIVPAAVIFDFGSGAAEPPTAEDGYQAAASASAGQDGVGAIGAGTGATVAKLSQGSTPGGLGIATVRAGPADVTAVVVVNALGDVRDPETGRWLARAGDAVGPEVTGRALALEHAVAPRLGESTTIGVVLVSESVDRETLARCCVAAHDGLARCVVPAHTAFDGDTFFAAAPSATQIPLQRSFAIAVAAEMAVERAIVRAIERS